MRMMAAWALCALFLLFPACRFEPGKPFTWTSTVETEFQINAGEEHALGAWQVADPFELGPGTTSLKFKYRVPSSEMALIPPDLTWKLRVYDQTFSTMRFEYSLDLPGKMKPTGGGSAYNLTYQVKKQSFPGWNLNQYDNVVYLLQPSGGAITSGKQIFGQYVYVSN